MGGSLQVLQIKLDFLVLNVVLAVILGCAFLHGGVSFLHCFVMYPLVQFCSVKQIFQKTSSPTLWVGIFTFTMVAVPNSADSEYYSVNIFWHQHGAVLNRYFGNCVVYCWSWLISFELITYVKRRGYGKHNDETN